VDRVLGSVRGSEAGPTLIGVGGLHGNETAGVHALSRVLEGLTPKRGHLRGELVALLGNRAAYAQGRRFLHRDLNRSWTPEQILTAKRAGPAAEGEDRELMELQGALDAILRDARGPVLLLDLHTTSGPGIPFSAIMDSPSNRELALGLPVPLVLGFGRLMDGTFFGYLTGRGITSMVFEGGQHRDPSSVDAAEAAVWMGLATAGMIGPEGFPQVEEARGTLARMVDGIPRILDIRHRHPVHPGDGFRMEPGFRNFQPVSAGQLLARDHHGEIRSPLAGLLLLPLYQKQGEDGFFLIREKAREE
jgi:succinylglutamate desuccinylase